MTERAKSDISTNQSATYSLRNTMITKVRSSSPKELVDHKINSKTKRNFLKSPSWLNKIITKNDDNLGIMHIK